MPPGKTPALQGFFTFIPAAMVKLDPKWRDRLFLLGALALMIAFSIDSSCRRGNVDTKQFFQSKPFFGRKIFQKKADSLVPSADTAAVPIQHP